MNWTEVKMRHDAMLTQQPLDNHDLKELNHLISIRKNALKYISDLKLGHEDSALMMETIEYANRQIKAILILE